MQREKRERYLASDEYKALVEKEAKENKTIKVAASSQLSEDQVLGGKADHQVEAGKAQKEWIEAVLGVVLEGKVVEGVAVEALKSGEVRKFVYSSQASSLSLSPSLCVCVCVCVLSFESRRLLNF